MRLPAWCRRLFWWAIKTYHDLWIGDNFVAKASTPEGQGLAPLEAPGGLPVDGFNPRQHSRCTYRLVVAVN